jgi:hypothetical protein
MITPVKSHYALLFSVIYTKIVTQGHFFRCSIIIDSTNIASGVAHRTCLGAVLDQSLIVPALFSPIATAFFPPPGRRRRLVRLFAISRPVSVSRFLQDPPRSNSHSSSQHDHESTSTVANNGEPITRTNSTSSPTPNGIVYFAYCHSSCMNRHPLLRTLITVAIVISGRRVCRLLSVIFHKCHQQLKHVTFCMRLSVVVRPTTFLL